ncbi:hypothetical protein FRB90_003636 [Tulasnella sp. 427]|nr:hypothetical protein FRB90_003636 [Tulasnella sp. 427]
MVDGNNDYYNNHATHNHDDPHVFEDFEQHHLKSEQLDYTCNGKGLSLSQAIKLSEVWGLFLKGFDISGTKPNAGNVFGNPAYPGNTACGTVTNWIDEMVTRYNESYIYAYNFAVSGATIDNSIVPAYSTSIKSVTEQVAQFTSNLGSKPSNAPWTSATAIFSFFIGINDIGNSYTSGDRTDTLLTAYFNQVQKIYDAGGRNFLFVNVPPVERSPLVDNTLQMVSQSSASTEKAEIISYNTKLASKIQAFKSSHSDVTTYLYDSWSKLTQILNSPKTYGFQDATSQGSGSNVVWCNVYHVVCSPAYGSVSA